MSIYNKILVSMLCFLINGCAPTDINSNRALPEIPWKLQARLLSKDAIIDFPASSAKLSYKTKENIRELFSAMDLDQPFYARISVNKPTSGSQASLIKQRIGTIKRYLKYLGVKNHRINTHYLSPLKADHHHSQNSIKLYIDQYLIILPACPSWDEASAENPDFMPDYNNFGCISQHNLAHMIAEPRDIYEAQNLGEGDGGRNVKILSPASSVSAAPAAGIVGALTK